MAKKHRLLKWDKLDNTAQLFPSIAGQNMTNVYRISVTLTEEIDPELLQKALDMVLPKFYGFNVRMRRGVFWYYFEENGKKAPRVVEENMFPCRYITQNSSHNYLFRVSYYQKRINLEVFHVLADGMGGFNFIRELTYQYIRLKHPQEFAGEKDELSHDTSLNLEDSFVKNYKKSRPSGFKNQRAYLIKGKKLQTGEFGLIHGLMPVSMLKEAAKKYGATINEYLVSVFAWSIYVECLHKMPSAKPIRVAVPVNLRPYFESVTTRNFFVMVSAEFFPTKEDHTFEEVIEQVKQSLRSQIKKEHLEDLFSYSVSNQKRNWMRAIPLSLKNVAMKTVYTRLALANTTTLTNVGGISLKEQYRPYVKMFHACIAMSAGQDLKATICSYEGTLVLTFSSVYADTIVQRRFFKTIAEDGVNVQVETNGVYYE